LTKTNGFTNPSLVDFMIKDAQKHSFPLQG